jgi:tetratricopeptide (TPR) repeat protein
MAMRQTDRLEQLLDDVKSELGEVVLAAAKGLLELGEYGQPAGIYLLKGGKAALGVGRLADAVVLLYHGLRVAEPNTKLWADLLVNRASACAHHGFYRDAITAGEQFLGMLDNLPPEASTYIPYAHHAVGFAWDKLKEHTKAATHFRMAVETYQDPDQRAISACDLAWALTLSGQAEAAEHVLSQVPDSQDSFATFVLSGTAALVHYHRGRFAEAAAAAERAEALAFGNETTWANSLAEVQYWLSRSAWELGDRYRAAAVALRVAVVADQHWNLDLRDQASAWLAEIMDKGGIQNA